MPELQISPNAKIVKEPLFFHRFLVVSQVDSVG